MSTTMTPPVRSDRRWWPPLVAGLLSMAALIGLQEALNSLNQAIPSAASAAAQSVVRLTPGPIITVMTDTLGKTAIQLLTGSAYIGTAVLGGLIVTLAARLGLARRLGPALALLAGLPLLLYLVVALIQVRSAGDYALVVLVGVAGALLFAGLALVLWRGLQPSAFAEALAPMGAVDPTRRGLLSGGLAAVAMLAGGGTLLSQNIRGQVRTVQDLEPLTPVAAVKPTTMPPTAPPAAAATATLAVAASSAGNTPAPPAAVATATSAPPTPTPGPSPEELEERYFAGIKGITPEISAIGKFYVVDEAIDDPRVDAKSWKLTVKGLVERPITLTYDELRGRPSIDHVATLMCISYEPGKDLISNAKWRGIRLADLLKEAGVKPGATHVVLRSVDDYDESHRLERALDPGAVLAYGMNDKVLPIDHGFPVRALVPGLYGYKNVKWLTEIEVVDKPLQGYWQRASGRNQEAVFQGAISRIDAVDSPPVKVGGEARVAGIAFAGPKGISKVELSDDGGQSWQLARLKKALSPYAWQLWAVEWKPKKAGKVKLLVRAYEGDGKPQLSEPRPPHPDGGTGLHGFDFEVVS